MGAQIDPRDYADWAQRHPDPWHDRQERRAQRRRLVRVAMAVLATVAVLTLIAECASALLTTLPAGPAIAAETPVNP